MEKIREYIFSIMIVSLSGAAVNMLAPENSNLSKYVHFLIALVISLVMLSPLYSFIYELPDIFDKEYIQKSEYSISSDLVSENAIIAETIEIMKKEVETAIESRFNCDVKEIEIICNTDDIEKIYITYIKISYEKENKYLFSDTKKYITDLFNCECEVVCVDRE